MNKKKIIWVSAIVVGLLVLGAGGFIGYRLLNRGPFGFQFGPGRGFVGRNNESGDRVFGEVLSNSNKVLTLEDQDGNKLEFDTNDDTLYFSPDDTLNTFQDLESGMQVSVLYESQSDGSLTALSIGSGQPSGGSRNFGNQNDDN